MMLFDTADGCFMNIAYGWASPGPSGRSTTTLVITALAIGAPFIIAVAGGRVPW
jgi:nickel/cobalt transporter (NiCoT) family protein